MSRRTRSPHQGPPQYTEPSVIRIIAERDEAQAALTKAVDAMDGLGVRLNDAERDRWAHLRMIEDELWPEIVRLRAALTEMVDLVERLTERLPNCHEPHNLDCPQCCLEVEAEALVATQGMS